MTVLQATATVAGVGAVTANTRQRWSSFAEFDGAGQAALSLIGRLQAALIFPGAGLITTAPGVIWLAVSTFNARSSKLKAVAGIDLVNSEAFIVRDKIMARLRLQPFFSSFAKFSTNTAEQIQPENIPFLGVYFINEDLTADGDDNAGDVRFRSAATYGVSIIVQNNDGAAGERKLDQAWKQFTKIFVDPTLYNWKNAAVAWRDGSEVLIQSYRRGNRSHVFGSVGKENAIPIAEMRFNLTCDLGILAYDPVITDDFNTMHVTTIYPGGDDPAAIAARQQVEAEIDIPQNQETVMKVWPTNTDARKHLRHPTGGAFRAEGHMDWPDDSFTARRIADGDVTTVEPNPQPVAPPTSPPPPEAEVHNVEPQEIVAGYVDHTKPPIKKPLKVATKL